MAECGFLDPFACGKLPLAEWMTAGLRWAVDNYRPFFQAVKAPVDSMLLSFTAALGAVPPMVVVLVVALVAWQIAGIRLALGLVAILLFVGFIGVWPETMLTLAIVLTSLIFSLALGIPLGIWASRSETLYAILRPLLDGMQTIPAFVYLVPVVMLFGIGNVPGVIVTVIFAVAPVIRLTYLGMKQVPGDVVEAMRAFGATESQLLWKAQLPLAMPTIMAGVNQTLMMSLSMVVIASMIAVGGLGQMVLRGIGRLDIGIATVGGVGIVALAIVLDRLTQALAKPRKKGEWLSKGPIGLVRSVAKTSRTDQAQQLPSSAIKN
ncbi:ABC transporter permease [Sinorhizobium americanum]|uniref:Glycine betaine transport system permease protein opuAB n=1 Tax=Sinorhizobium americanum TaxID=194963 RepID=A0A1L3LIU5_9HYPH|nr:ABC transporter permease subunit [Sinorhizobium americanum]APG83398.1 glycine betaine transport system permease protein opuAB [Sinorhizobium americanum CCGM7]APG89933.1 glycine betaine transport system permease protein opuAB [Sinorhizobium americanum]OAP47232.1 glycine/betaine ABC transporter permease [Sinorhizobium americanum]